MIYIDFNFAEKFFVKKAFFGNKLVNKNNKKIKMPKNSKIKLKLTNKGIALLDKNRKQIVAENFDNVTFDTNNNNCIYLLDSKTKGILRVDCLTGKHTPVCETIYFNSESKHCIDLNGNVLKLDDEMAVTETGLVNIKNKRFSTTFKNQDGKYVFLDYATLKPLIKKEFETDNVMCSALVRDSRYNNLFMVFSKDKMHYIVDKNGNILRTIENENLSISERYFIEDGRLVHYLRCYDNKSNKSEIIIFDDEKQQIAQSLEIKNLAIDIHSRNGKRIITTSDLNQKVGIVDENDNIIVENKYDSIDFENIYGTKPKENKFNRESESIICIEHDGKKGILTFEGKELLPCNYVDIDFDNSFKIDDSYKFLAKNENNLFGVINSEGKIEAEFVYKRTSHETSVRNMSNNNSFYKTGLMLINTKTGKTDYFIQHDYDCLLKAEDSEEEELAEYIPNIPKQKKNKVNVREYSYGEILQKGILNGVVIDNIGLGIIMTEIAIRDKKVKNKSEDEMEF